MTDRRLRQFTLTGGRARPESALPLETPITVCGPGVAHAASTPEQQAILQRCTRPQTVVDLSSALDAPVGVVRVLVLDLVEAGAVTVHLPTAEAPPPHRDLNLLEEALHGIGNL